MITIDSNCITNFTEEKSWIQTSCTRILNVPLNKPDIKKIENVYAYTNILKTKIIQTPNSHNIPSLNGDKLTGYFLNVYGEIYEKILYMSCDCAPNLVYLIIKIPFVKNIPLSPTTDLQRDKFIVEPYIEDISNEFISKRSLLCNACIYLEAKNMLKG